MHHFDFGPQAADVLNQRIINASFFMFLSNCRQGPQKLDVQVAYEAGVYGIGWPKSYGGTTPTAEEIDTFAFSE